MNIRLGGEYLPKPKNKVAIIVPYRNRPDHLKIFLRHIHPFLIKQNIHYSIYVVEPIQNITYNKGIVLNAGFLESLKLSNDTWDCHIFHDVDMWPEDDRQLYTCPDTYTARHLAVAQTRWNYTLV